MNRFAQSGFYSFLVTLYGMCFYYGIGVAVTLAQGGDLVKFFWDCLTGGFVLFIFLWFVFYELTGAFERLNQPRDKDDSGGDDKGTGGPQG